MLRTAIRTKQTSNIIMAEASRMSTAKQEVQASTEARTRPRVANLLMIRYLGSVRLPDLLLLSQQGVRQAEYRPPGRVLTPAALARRKTGGVEEAVGDAAHRTQSRLG
jgi:hypothetical protein